MTPQPSPGHVPVYSITYAELTTIGIFLLVAAVCFVRRREVGTFLLLFAAGFFALRPLLVFTIPSQKVVNLTAYFPSMAFGALIAFLVIQYVVGKTDSPMPPTKGGKGARR
ncbi:MAG TPA: hypothetical protein VIM61_13125 [Chthoniobacterales bacterium]|jgi:hypothetical protein